MLGKLKKDAEAPRDIYQGLCDDCQGVIDQGGAMIIEVKDGETGENPSRTGRIVGVSKDFKERNKLESSLMYMHHHVFDSIFGKVDFSK